MKLFESLTIAVATLTAGLFVSTAWAVDVRHSTPGLSGYDPVAYLQTANRFAGPDIVPPFMRA